MHFKFKVISEGEIYESQVSHSRCRRRRHRCRNKEMTIYTLADISYESVSNDIAAHSHEHRFCCSLV